MLTWVEEKEHFLTTHLGEVPDVLSINFYENYMWLLTLYLNENNITYLQDKR